MSWSRPWTAPCTAAGLKTTRPLFLGVASPAEIDRYPPAVRRDRRDPAGGQHMAQFETLTYAVDDRLARITLNRPERLNAINRAMPGEIQAAGAAANQDETGHVIVLRGAGRAFCAGYDLDWGTRIEDAAQAQAGGIWG